MHTENNFAGSVLSFHLYVASRETVRITSPGGKYLYLLGRLTDLIYANLKRENRGLKAIHPKLTRVEQT